MKGRLAIIAVLAALLASCAPVDLNAPVPVFDTGIDPTAWADVPAGEFYYGQHEAVQTTDAYSIHQACRTMLSCSLQPPPNGPTTFIVRQGEPRPTGISSSIISFYSNIDRPQG